MNNPWNEFDYTLNTQIHPLDYDTVITFNERVNKTKNAEKYRLSEHHTALPYFGSLNSSLVILAANPGLDPVATKEEETPHRRELFDQARRHGLDDNPFVFLRPEFEGTVGYKWWLSRTRRLREEMGDHKFMHNTFSAEIHPYKSINYRKLYEPLPTQEYTFSVVNDLVSQGAWVILMRAKNEWRAAVPALLKSQKIIELNSPQSSYLTPGNMKPGIFEKLVTI